MDHSFDSATRFPGNGDGFHRHSQSTTNHLGLDFQSMMPPPPKPSDSARMSAGGSSTTGAASSAYESHDDLCVDHCMGVGLYNGFQQFNHRGGQTTAHARWARENAVSGYEYSLGIGAMPMQFRNHYAGPQSSNPYQQSWFSHNLDSAVRCSDEDCQSVGDMSCCDSHCTMTGKCTDIACADTEDACTDQNCPSRPGPVPSSEVVNGAAALISINHAPEEPSDNFNLQHSGIVMGAMDFSLSGNAQQDYLMSSGLLPGPVGSIATHLLVAHGDADSANCTSPCPLNDPQNYPYCHLPVYSNPSPFHQYDSVGSDGQMNHGFVECGAEFHDPESFLAHFNSQHRPHFTGAVPNFFRCSATGMHRATELTAAESMSPPATPLDTSDSGASSGTPSPLTPLSNSLEMTDVKPKRSSHVRGASVVSSISSSARLGVEEEHRCLWKEEGSSDICGQTFSDAEELFKHASECHIKHAQKGAQGFRCGWDDCPRSEPGAAGFPQRSKIERHMQTHIGHKPHICPTCNKGFSAKQALTQHMFIHSNEKPLVCNICNKAFRYPSALTMHQRVHSGLKPLKCPVCGKGFSESSNLSKHKRTHEVKGRFTCTVPGCDRNFHRQDQLRRHMKTHQKDNNSRPASASESGVEGIYEQLPQS